MDPEALPIRSDGFAPAGFTPSAVAPAKGMSNDEVHESTLRSVQRMLHEGMDALYKDFNAFQLTAGVPKTTALYDLEKQIAGKQTAYDILAPLVEGVDAALAKIDMKYKQ